MHWKYSGTLFFFCLLGIISALSGCDEYCDRGTTSAMVVSLYTIEEDGTEKELQITDFSITGVGAIANSSRLTLYETKWLLPLSNSSDTTRFALQIRGCTPDTMVVVAPRHVKLVSDVCGCTTLSTIDTVYFVSAIDTIKSWSIPDRSVRVLTFAENYRYVDNLKIFF